MKDITISVANDFSTTPGPRTPDEGPWSGEEFLEKMLKGAFQSAIDAGCNLLIDLDGAQGYATSFLEAAFGGLARIHEPGLVESRILFKCLDEPYLEEEIVNYIREAREG